MSINKPIFTIKPVGENDQDAVLDVYRQCEDFLALGPEPRASLRMVQKDIENSKKAGGMFSSIINKSGKMIGVIDFIASGFERKPDIAYISLLMIAPNFRNFGIGAEIVKSIENEFQKECSITAIQTSVQVNNPAALRFWHRLGFRIISGPHLRPDSTTVYHLQKRLERRSLDSPR
jgi:ribosomal protein S18 acetylase RimI-like enzyme